MGGSLAGREGALVWATLVLTAGRRSSWGLWRFVQGDRAEDINNPDGARSHPAGTEGNRRRAWLLGSLLVISVIGSAIILFLIGLDKLGISVGRRHRANWIMWLAERGDFIRPESTNRHLVAATEEWQPWLLLSLIGVSYGLSFFFPVCPSFRKWAAFPRTGMVVCTTHARLAILAAAHLVRGYESLHHDTETGQCLVVCKSLVVAGLSGTHHAPVALGGLRWAARVAPVGPIKVHRHSSSSLPAQSILPGI